MSRQLRIDARLTLDGEFTAAMRGLAHAGTLLRVPHEALLHLYCYEVLERLRGGSGELRVPFWPLALFVAADVLVHAGHEITALYPTLERTTWCPRDGVDVEAAARKTFGIVPFDPDRYVLELARTAAERHWTRS
jgi:hypothetical protein